MNYKRYFTENSPLFVTLVTYKRQYILLDNIQLLRDAFKNAKQYFNFQIIAICIMQDHIHMIISPENVADYPRIITSIKYYFSKNVDVGQECPTYGYINKREKGIWQRRFYEHTISNEEDLNRHIDYIHYNSYKHYNILPKDWEHSSFDKFVQNGFYEKNWIVDDKVFEGIGCE